MAKERERAEILKNRTQIQNYLKAEPTSLDAPAAFQVADSFSRAGPKKKNK